MLLSHTCVGLILQVLLYLSHDCCGRLGGVQPAKQLNAACPLDLSLGIPSRGGLDLLQQLHLNTTSKFQRLHSTMVPARHHQLQA